MKILLACSAGMSTSLLENSLNKYMKENNIDGFSEAHSSGEAKTRIDEFDIILLGPQVKFMLKDFQELAGSKPVGVISPADYAMAKAENIFEYAKTLIKEKK